MHLLQRKFPQIPEAYRKEMEHADTNKLLEWGECLVDAKILEDVFED